jgi:hypothetical protein
MPGSLSSGYERLGGEGYGNAGKNATLTPHHSAFWEGAPHLPYKLFTT